MDGLSVLRGLPDRPEQCFQCRVVAGKMRRLRAYLRVTLFGDSIAYKYMES